jgi:hypothetical protein
VKYNPNGPGRRNCFYCKTAFSWDDPESDAYPTREHKQPKSKGGSNHGGNVTLACKRCNGEKGDMTVVEFRKYMEVTKGFATRTMRQICWKKHLGQWSPRIVDPARWPKGWNNLISEEDLGLDAEGATVSGEGMTDAG